MKKLEYLENLEKIVWCLMETETYDDVFWNTAWFENRPDELICLVNCNDLFFWGCADAEPLRVEDLDDYRKACEDAGVYGSLLYCCRKTGMRPQGAYYEHIDKEYWHHFDACGPERKADVGNPKNRPRD